MNSSTINNIHRCFKSASERYNFKFDSPYTLYSDYIAIDVFALISGHDNINNIILSLIYPPNYEIDNRIISLCEMHNYKYTFINADVYSNCDSELIRETLIDWGVILK